MVAQFGRDHYHLSEAEIAQLSSQVREGDLSSVLKAYEEAIKVGWDFDYIWPRISKNIVTDL